MTESLINITMLLATALAAVSTPWSKRRIGARTASIQRLIFKALVTALYLFSLHETIKEDGALYGIIFSLIPLIAGAVVFGFMKSRHSRNPLPKPIDGSQEVASAGDDTPARR